MSFGLCVSALCLPLTSAAAPELDPVSERANNLFKKGKQAYEEGKDQESYRLLREAWSLRKSSDIAANLALIESELGKYRDAAEHYSFALRNLLPSSTDAQKQALLKGLEEAKQYITVLRLTVEPAGAEVFVNGESIGKAPLGDDVFVAPGENVISAKLDRFTPLERRIHGAPGATQVVWLKLERAKTAATSSAPSRQAATVGAAPAQPTSSPSAPDSQRTIIPAVALSGVAAIAGASGVIFTLEANSAQNTADEITRGLGGGNACGPGTQQATQCSNLRDANERVEKNRNLATVGFVVAGAAGLGTIVYLLWPDSDNSVRARGAILPGHGEFAISGAF